MLLSAKVLDAQFSVVTSLYGCVLQYFILYVIQSSIRHLTLSWWRACIPTSESLRLVPANILSLRFLYN